MNAEQATSILTIVLVTGMMVIVIPLGLRSMDYVKREIYTVSIAQDQAVVVAGSKTKKAAFHKPPFLYCNTALCYEYLFSLSVMPTSDSE